MRAEYTFIPKQKSNEQHKNVEKSTNKKNSSSFCFALLHVKDEKKNEWKEDIEEDTKMWARFNTIWFIVLQTRLKCRMGNKKCVSEMQQIQRKQLQRTANRLDVGKRREWTCPHLMSIASWTVSFYTREKKIVKFFFTKKYSAAGRHQQSIILSN